MEGIYTYHIEFLKPLLPCLSFLGNCNIIFLDSNGSFFEKYWRFFYIIPFFILNYMSLSMYIVKLFTEGLDPFEKADMIPMWLVSTQVLNKSAIIVSWQYLLLPLVETIIRILFLAEEAELALPFACVYPFAADNWPTYLGVYAFQIYNVFLAVFSYLGSNLLLVALSTHLRIQFILLQEDLENIKPSKNSKVAEFDFEDEITKYREWSSCNIEEFVRRHQDIILLTQQLNAVFNKIVFLNLLFSTLIICFFAIAAKASSGAAYMLNNIAAIVLIIMTVLIICYCSELLSTSSMGIAHSAVKNIWYKGDLRYQTIIYFIIMRSQNPCTLRSLNYSLISMKTFNKVLKTTYSYFSLASQMYDERD